MTDRKTIEYWKERLDQEENSFSSDCGKLERENGYILAKIYELMSEYNKNERRITQCKWHWWYQIKLAERTLKKFKIKSEDIYRSRRATNYWRNRLHKHCKMKPKGTLNHPGAGHIIGFLGERAISSGHSQAYYLVIQDLVREIERRG